jgi:uncharacterized protein YkwD
MKIFSALNVGLLLATLTFVNGINKSTNESKTDPNGTVPTNLNNSLVLALVNKVRTTGCNCGNTYMPAAAPLTWSETIAQASLNHSKDMDRNRFFRHESYDGRKLRDRFEEVGYKWRAIAENIAYGQKNEEAVVKAWFNSPGHCRNMMDPDYQEIGAAKAGIYWTMDLGTKRNW